MAKGNVSHDMRFRAGKLWRDTILKPAILANAIGRTLRGLQYVLVGIIAKTRADFQQVNNIVKAMRLSGELGWDDLDERHRELRARSGWPEVADFIDSLDLAYTRDYQSEQPKHVVVLYEADGMTGLVQEVCRAYGTTYAAMKGNSSDVLQWKLVVGAYGSPIVAIVITDHDGSGQAIWTDIKNSLPWFYLAHETERTVKATVESVMGGTFDAYAPMPPFTHPDVTVIHLGVHPALLDDLTARGYVIQSDPEAEQGRQGVRQGRVRGHAG